MRTILSGTEGTQNQVTLGEFFSHLSGDHWKADVLLWPPDVFCLVAALLHKTGGYTRYITKWPPSNGKAVESHEVRLHHWTEMIRKLGSEWWLAASLAIGKPSGQVKPPKTVHDWWRTVIKDPTISIADLESDLIDDRVPFWNALLQLCSAADEACFAIGFAESSPYAINLPAGALRPDTDMLWAASKRLISQRFWNQPPTLTRDIKSSAAVVLPKMHTPQSGITLRSISHNLALIRASEVVADYGQSIDENGADGNRPKNTVRSLNLLLFPWPLKIVPADFRPVESEDQTLVPEFGFFAYEPQEPQTIRSRLKEMRTVIRKAVKTLGRIDGVVFPEMALTDRTVRKVFEAVRAECPTCFLISGIRSNGVDDDDFRENRAVLLSALGDSVAEQINQEKHHRWQLDRSQIDQYGLGSRLDPTKRGWWECIKIRRRKLSFVSINDETTLSVLICEDLARQDPIAEIIRNVGPQLIVALLMDGPQLGNRWPARYATVFADDPGSSVLTLTSLGMTELSRPPGRSPSRVVGLWKDRFQGLREIKLETTSQAVALSLNIENHTEWTADGRKDNEDSTCVRLSGIHQI